MLTKVVSGEKLGLCQSLMKVGKPPWSRGNLELWRKRWIDLVIRRRFVNIRSQDPCMIAMRRWKLGQHIHWNWSKVCSPRSLALEVIHFGPYVNIHSSLVLCIYKRVKLWNWQVNCLVILASILFFETLCNFLIVTSIKPVLRSGSAYRPNHYKLHRVRYHFVSLKFCMCIHLLIWFHLKSAFIYSPRFLKGGQQLICVCVSVLLFLLFGFNFNLNKLFF